jgi:hypothetical protein
MAGSIQYRERFVNKTKLNYWVDVAIGIAGVISAVTGLAMLLPANSASGILGVSLRLWSSMHTWSSLAAVAGVGAHLALHWKWATAMTGQLLATNRPETAAAAGDSGMSRRAFLALGGATAVVVGLAAAGYKAIAQAVSGGDDETDSTASLGNGTASGSARQASGVACPRGLTNDPYPGQCRHYVDSDGDGICDYSVAGTGSNTAGSFGGGPGGAFPGRPGGVGRP